LFRPTGLVSLIVSERERIGTFGRSSGSTFRRSQEGGGGAA
jgi:hypothetical protein